MIVPDSSHSSVILTDGTRVSGQADAVGRALAIDRDMQAQRRQWIADLRERGIKAAHPDDGWVDRDEDKIHLCYPDFNDGLAVGGLLALGWPWQDTRIVRITGVSANRFAVPYVRDWWFHFEAAE